MEEHIADFIPLVMKQARRLAPGDAFTREDLIQEGLIAVFKATASYEPDRGPLAAYVQTCVRNAMISYGRKHLYNRAVEYSDEVRNDETSMESSYEEKLEMRESFDRLVSLLTDVERAALRAYLSGGGIAEAAKTLNWTRKRMDNALQRVRAKARKCLIESEES